MSQNWLRSHGLDNPALQYIKFLLESFSFQYNLKGKTVHIKRKRQRGRSGWDPRNFDLSKHAFSISPVNSDEFR